MVNRSLDHIDTLVIHCPSWVGDIVMATPTFDCFRENLPNTKIVGLLKKNAQGIVRDGPWFDGFIDCQNRSWSGFWHTIKQIRGCKPDMAVLLPNSIRSALTVRLGGAKKVYGYRRDLRGAFLSSGPKPVRSNHEIVPVPMTRYYLEICRWLGLKTPEQAKPRLFVGEKLLKRGQSLIQKYGIQEKDFVVGLNPGASFGASKCWPPERFAKLAELCETEFNAKLLLLSGPGEQEIARAVMAKSLANIIDTGPDKVDLELLKPLVRRCNLLVTNDTGPRHYAVALDVPAVVIMGPTDPRHTAANLDRTVVVRKELDCSPCHKKVCPLEHQCMTEITADEVLAVAAKLLEECK
ncbi:MAG: lipopolysaccharide heptosyltransferase II [Planctomycetes bacterium B3_Pla]|nr:MAG: lipopolysaccharide heptosyltransferase II [Planctomycetes bacterium B3_Pla]